MAATTTFAASVALGAWSISAWLSHPAGGLAMFAIALIGLAVATGILRDGVRLLRLADAEDRMEMERAIRPRL